MSLSSNIERLCRICALAEGSSTSNGYDQAWAEDDLYFALVSIGALVPGWSLVFPKKHSLNLSSSYGDPEFWSFVDFAHAAVENRYGSSVIFEHGCQREGSQTSCGTAHAHLHIVPLDMGLVESARNYDPSLAWVSCAAKDIHAYVDGREYLFVADRYQGKSTRGSLAILIEGRSQYFRRVIAEMIGRPGEFDYRLHPQTNIATQSAAALSEYVMRPVQASAA